jgi:archaellin
MKKYLLILIAFILTAAVVTATVLNNNKKVTAKAKKECSIKKTECGSEKKSKCMRFFSCS